MNAEFKKVNICIDTLKAFLITILIKFELYMSTNIRQDVQRILNFVHFHIVRFISMIIFLLLKTHEFIFRENCSVVLSQYKNTIIIWS